MQNHNLLRKQLLGKNKTVCPAFMLQFYSHTQRPIKWKEKNEEIKFRKEEAVYVQAKRTDNNMKRNKERTHQHTGRTFK